MIMENLLMNKHTVLVNLSAGLSFASDADAIKMLMDKYATAECVYTDPGMMAARLQAKADIIRDEIEQLYKTTLFKYEAMYNLDRYDEFTDEEITKRAGSASDKQVTEGSDHNSGTGSQYPMGAAAGTSRPVTKTDTESSNESTVTGSAQHADDENRIYKHTQHSYGNIGITTSAQLITGAREIIINVLNEWAKRFNDLFMFTI